MDHYKHAWEHAQQATAEANKDRSRLTAPSRVGEGPASAGPFFLLAALPERRAGRAAFV